MKFQRRSISEEAGKSSVRFATFFSSTIFPDPVHLFHLCCLLLNPRFATRCPVYVSGSTLVFTGSLACLPRYVLYGLPGARSSPYVAGTPTNKAGSYIRENPLNEPPITRIVGAWYVRDVILKRRFDSRSLRTAAVQYLSTSGTQQQLYIQLKARLNLFIQENKKFGSRRTEVTAVV